MNSYLQENFGDMTGTSMILPKEKEFDIVAGDPIVLPIDQLRHAASPKLIRKPVYNVFRLYDFETYPKC